MTCQSHLTLNLRYLWLQSLLRQIQLSTHLTWDGTSGSKWCKKEWEEDKSFLSMGPCSPSPKKSIQDKCNPELGQWERIEFLLCRPSRFYICIPFRNHLYKISSSSMTCLCCPNLSKRTFYLQLSRCQIFLVAMSFKVVVRN